MILRLYLDASTETPAPKDVADESMEDVKRRTDVKDAQPMDDIQKTSDGQNAQPVTDAKKSAHKIGADSTKTSHQSSPGFTRTLDKFGEALKPLGRFSRRRPCSTVFFTRKEETSGEESSCGFSI